MDARLVARCASVSRCLMLLYVVVAENYGANEAAGSMAYRGDEAGNVSFLIFKLLAAIENKQNKRTREHKACCLPHRAVGQQCALYAQTAEAA